MREIKFRVWNKESEIMNNQDEVIIMLDKDGIGVCYDTGSEYRDLNYPKEVLVYMQYTGLKDKNGKEIYEGDILSYKHIKYTDCSKEDIEDIEEEVLIGLITYRPLASIIKPYSEYVMCLGYDNINKECLVIDLESEEVEVLGNVYDNPELLK